MVTEKHKTNKSCLFCASEYHLEMILLPYMKSKISTSKFVIFTEKNLKKSLNTLLSKINLDENSKKEIRNIDWGNNNKSKFNKLEEYIKNNENINIIINGEFDFIEEINNNLKGKVNENVEIVDCFHIEDTNIDIKEIKNRYKYVLNTQKMQ